jgi:hypothetical protein
MKNQPDFQKLPESQSRSAFSKRTHVDIKIDYYFCQNQANLQLYFSAPIFL